MHGKPPFREPLTIALRHAIAHLNGIAERSVDATASLEDLRRRIDVPLTNFGLAPELVIDELVKACDGGIVGSAGPRFFGFVIGGSLPAALAADWLTSAWDQNAGLYVIGPAASLVEEVAGTWLKELFGLPAQASFAFVTGCQMAHVTCLAAARHRVLERSGWDVERDGLGGAPAIRILTSTEQHATVPRAARLLGMGTKCIETLPCDEVGRLRADALQAALKQNGDPIIVVLQAGDLNRGAFDDFSTLIPLAHEHGAWVHVDGAMGLWCAASANYKHLLRGVEAADSWSSDGHKWLNVPYDCGYAFVRDAEAHFASQGVRSSYLVQGVGARDEVDWTPEFSRRARGFATYAALRQLGRSGVEELVDRCCRVAAALIERIGALDGAEALCPPLINQGMVRFFDPRADATDADHDCMSDAVIARIRETGEAFFTPTTWHGVRAMRISVSNWQTTMDDVDPVVACVANVLGAERAKLLAGEL